MKSQAFHGEVWVNAEEEIAQALLEINREAIDGGYGNDSYTKLATALMQQYFDEPIATTFAFNGTAANVMALKAMLDRYSAIICAEQTHIHTYEAGAFEYNLGNKILTVKTEDGKLTPALIDRLLLSTKKYKYQPKVVAMAQPTEFGTVYTVEEIRAICEHAHKLQMYVYVDGARIGNAVAALQTDLRKMLGETGVDAFSFGGTKAGAMFGEMVVFRRPEFVKCLSYSQKQSLQHLSKSKFLSAQIAMLLEKDIWLKNARRSNEMAKTLEKMILAKGLPLAYKVESNMVFCVIEPEKFAPLCEKYDMHYWDEEAHVVRLATTHKTTEEDLLALCRCL